MPISWPAPAAGDPTRILFCLVLTRALVGTTEVNLFEGQKPEGIEAYRDCKKGFSAYQSHTFLGSLNLGPLLPGSQSTGTY